MPNTGPMEKLPSPPGELEDADLSLKFLKNNVSAGCAKAEKQESKRMQKGFIEGKMQLPPKNKKTSDTPYYLKNQDQEWSQF